MITLMTVFVVNKIFIRVLVIILVTDVDVTAIIIITLIVIAIATVIVVVVVSFIVIILVFSDYELLLEKKIVIWTNCQSVFSTKTIQIT